MQIESDQTSGGTDERRPHRNLMIYYAAVSLMAGPFFFFPLIFYAFRYKTLRYTFDGEGVSMRWGALFRREIRLNYGRIQDIHLTSNFLERWLDLGRVQLQTASGAATAEMVIEGLPEIEEIRDLLYRRMLGEEEPEAVAAGAGGVTDRGGTVDAGAVAPTSLASGLREVAEELRAIRSLLAGSAVEDAAEGREP